MLADGIRAARGLFVEAAEAVDTIDDGALIGADGGVGVAVEAARLQSVAALFAGRLAASYREQQKEHGYQPHFFPLFSSASHFMSGAK